MKNYENRESKRKSFHSKDNGLNGNEDSNINSLENNEMLDNLIKISGNQEVYKELKDETSKIKQLLSQSKEKLSNIDLYEKQNSDIDIYQWNNLFNQSIPITSYVTSSKSIKNKINKKEENIENKENSKNMKHPVSLVDLNEDEIKKYLPPSPVGVPRSSVIRFQKLPFKGDSKDAFYFSNAFNDYYKMDFKDFIKIMPVLKAKKRCKSAKLNKQIRRSRRRSLKEEKKRELYKKQMIDKLNNLYIEKQYLSLSKNANNIQPLMSSIHAQIYPGEGDELTKHAKIYIKSDKPLGSERDIDSIDFTVNQRDYHRNELNRIKMNKKRAKSEIRKLSLPKYDINDPDIAIFKRIEVFDKIINEGDTNFLGNHFLIDEKEEKSIINCEGESKKEEEEENIDKNNINENKKIEKNETNLENQKNNENNYKLVNTDLKNKKPRAMSAKRKNDKNEETSLINNSNKKFPRAISAHAIRPIEKQNEYCIHNVYLSSKKKLSNHNAFRKNYYRTQRNKLNDIYDENKKGNTSSQISTYEGINNSIYEKQNIPRHGFPYKSSHQIQNKIYLKINKRLKEKQYEKYQQKLEQFSKLIRLDDEFLTEDMLKEKFDNNNINPDTELAYIDKNKIFNRPLSSYNKKELIAQKEKNNTQRLQTPKLFKYNKNNFRAVSKKSSNENSKLDFTTSVLNTKHEYFLNNNNDKVTLVYFNDIIETKPQNINEMKPIIKNDGIIVAPNYFNRGKPQLIHYHNKLKQKNNLRRIQSGKIFRKIHNFKDNVIIQEEHLGMFKKNNDINKIINNNTESRKRITSAKV